MLVARPLDPPLSSRPVHSPPNAPRGPLHPIRRRVAAGLALALLATAAVEAIPIQPLQLVVDTGNDELDLTPGDGVCEISGGGCSLRAAIQEGNGWGAAVILLPENPYTFQLTLHGPDEAGDLDVAGRIEIVGAGVGTSVIDGDAADRVFDVGSQASLTLRRLAVRNGKSAGSEGGGIRALGSLLLDEVAVERNAIDQFGGLGGGIWAKGDLLIERSRITENSCGWGFCNGGGLYYEGTDPARIVDSTLDGNRSAAHGGGLFLAGPAWIVNSTIASNQSGTDGGGIFCSSFLALWSSTIADNLADALDLGSGLGGGIASTFGTCDARIANSLIASNSVPAGPDDCAAALTSSGYNLIEDASGCAIVPEEGDQLGVAAGTLPLGAQGGPTPTVALANGSPALDSGNPGGCFGVLSLIEYDQRGAGFERAAFGRCDIGAWERQSWIFVGDFEQSLDGWSRLEGIILD